MTRPAVETAALQTHALTKRYGDLVALHPLELEIGAGQRVALVGHNGSGKTTLLRLVTGMLEPSGGDAAVCGAALGSIDARAAVSYLPDQPVFYDDLSVWEHLEYVARLHDTDDWEQHAVDLLHVLGLDDRADDLPVTFSRGLRQRTAIAIAFVRPFELLVVDEPFVGLDRAGRAALLQLFDLAHGDGAALLIATHELGTVGACERVIALSSGAVVHDGAPGDAEFAGLIDSPGSGEPG